MRITKERKCLIFLFLIICLFFIYSLINRATFYKREDKAGIFYWHGPVDKKNIALTFDDGPSECTPLILQTLQKYKVNATFFIVGKNAERLPNILKEEMLAGHVIGSHSYSHPDMQIELPLEVREQLDKNEEIIRNYTGLNMYLFRPPYGFNNPIVKKETAKRGYITIQWSVSGWDSELREPKEVEESVLKNVRNGSIILLHDGRRLTKNPDCNSTINAIPMIIENLRGRGYNFVTVPELLA